METTNITLKPFNLEKALNGHTIALSTNGETIDKIIYNFKKTLASGYVGNDESGKLYYFNAEGKSTESTGSALKLVIAQVYETSGTVGVRGENKEEITIDILQPREQFAISAMQGILNKMPCSILEIDEATCLLIAQKSFVIAQYMINTAAEYRATTKDIIPPDQVNIDSNTLNSVSDKILYNIWQATKGQNTQLLERLDITNTNLSNINTSIENGNNGTQKVNITNTASVNVTNNPSVYIANQPVSVTGSVNANVTNARLDVSGSNVNINNNPLEVSGSVSVANTPLSVSISE